MRSRSGCSLKHHELDTNQTPFFKTISKFNKNNNTRCFVVMGFLTFRIRLYFVLYVYSTVCLDEPTGLPPGGRAKSGTYVRHTFRCPEIGRLLAAVERVGVNHYYYVVYLLLTKAHFFRFLSGAQDSCWNSRKCLSENGRS